MSRAVLALLLLLLLPLLPFAAPAQAQPEIDYMLHCRGCHGPDGAAHPRVPSLRDGLGPLLRTAGGREYIVRVPGVARAALDDERLAALLNWLVARFAPEDNALPYAAADVAALRAAPLVDPAAGRTRLMERQP